MPSQPVRLIFACGLFDTDVSRYVAHGVNDAQAPNVRHDGKHTPRVFVFDHRDNHDARTI
jgi:hypothetical protein